MNRKIFFFGLTAAWNTFHKNKIRGLIDREDTTENRLRAQFIDFLDVLATDAQLLPSFDLPPRNNALPHENGVLMGRAIELQDIHTALQQDNAFVLVQGFGGLGKTTVLHSYLHTEAYQAHYPEILWLRVWDGEKGLQNALVAFFREKLGLREGSIDALFLQVLTHLQQYEKGSLLVLDNANESQDLLVCRNPLRNTGWKCLISTRCEINHKPTIHIKVFSLQKAKEIFAFYLGDNPALKNKYLNDPTLPQLLENIGYHTLLIEIIAKTLAQNAMATLAKMIELTAKSNYDHKHFQTNLSQVEHQNYQQTNVYELKAAYYLAQIFPLTNLSTDELQILLYFSILPAQPYPFTADPRNFDELHYEPICLLTLFDIEETEESETALADTLTRLNEKGLLQHEGEHTYYCHHVLHYAIHQHTKPTYENCEAVARGVVRTVNWDSYTNRILLADRLPLVENVLTYIATDTQVISDVYNNSAEIYRHFGNYEKALDYDVENVRISEKVLSNEDADLATSYNNIAITYRDLGKYDKALEYALKSIAILEKILSAEHPDLATSYGNIAITYIYLGKYDKALEYALKDIAIREKILSAEHPSLATSYSNIAITYRDLGKYDKALEYALKSIAIRENILSAEHPSLATSYHNISFTYTYLQKWEIALDYEKKALAIRLKVLPIGHPYTKTSIDNMKTMLVAAIKAEGQEKYREVQAWFEGVCEGYE